MKFTTLSTLLTFAFVSADAVYGFASAHQRAHLGNYKRGSVSQWAPAGPTDYRAPCPMMNTLANHGFLPHDGRNITKQVVVNALGSALNFDASLAELMFEMAIIVNPQPNATSFTLDQLNKHNLLEHDASLSRSDAYFGNNHIFNQSIFDQTRAYWTTPIINATQLANSKIARQVTSRGYNPTYTFTSNTEHFSLGEVAAPIIAFGDMGSGTVNRTLVEYFFENERLPSELGWTKKEAAISLSDISAVTAMIDNATSLLTS